MEETTPQLCTVARTAGAYYLPHDYEKATDLYRQAKVGTEKSGAMDSHWMGENSVSFLAG